MRTQLELANDRMIPAMTATWEHVGDERRILTSYAMVSISMMLCCSNHACSHSFMLPCDTLKPPPHILFPIYAKFNLLSDTAHSTSSSNKPSKSSRLNGTHSRSTPPAFFLLSII